MHWSVWSSYNCCKNNLLFSVHFIWIACKCREIQKICKKIPRFCFPHVRDMSVEMWCGAKSRDYPQNGGDLTCMQAIYILILSSSVQCWLVWLDITYVTGTVGAGPYTGMLDRVYTRWMEVLLWLHQNQLPGKFSIVDKDWIDNHIIINVTISAHDIVFCTPELTLN